MLLSGAVLISNLPYASSFNGIISSDTTWTKADSPIVLDGPVGVRTGVTLTIEPGVVIEGGYYIQINGTLQAQGTETQPIIYDHGEIRLMSSSTNSVIEYTRVYLINVYDCSPRISNNQIGGVTVNGNYEWTGGVKVNGGSPIITNNHFDQYEAYVVIGVVVNSGAPTITDNNLSRVTINGGTPTLTDNYISRGLVAFSGSTVTNNRIVGPLARNSTPTTYYDECGMSLSTDGSTFSVYGNLVTGWPIGAKTCQTPWGGELILDHNVIVNNRDVGVEILGKATLNSNTISNNLIAIKATSDAQATLRNNNIASYDDYSVYLDNTHVSVDATNNWWGTTDSAAISGSFFDSHKDFTLPTVTYEPFLSAPNPDAPVTPDDLPDYTQPTSTPAPTDSTSNEPTPPPNTTEQPAATPNSHSNQQSNTDNSEPFYLNLYLIGVGVIVTIGVIVVILRVGVKQNRHT